MTVTSLPFWSSTLSPSASAYLRPSWKMWPISMPRASVQRTRAVRRRVALPDLGGLDRPVGGEVAAADQVEDVPARLVGAGHPAGAGDHPRVDQVPDPARPDSAPRTAGPM